MWVDVFGVRWGWYGLRGGLSRTGAGGSCRRVVGAGGDGFPPSRE